MFLTIDGGATWSQQQKLLPVDGTDNDRFGYYLDIDGPVIVVGATQLVQTGYAFGRVLLTVRLHILL